ncbi:MAG: hypothetical protein ACTHLA_06250, partial [Asticcacaulis sp.]|uniref:hypothetical protein n=1 Tax=Asticcacaulis sp. TaxID=1872648 RepID=UPI003F7B3E34
MAKRLQKGVGLVSLFGLMAASASMAQTQSGDAMLDAMGLNNQKAATESHADLVPVKPLRGPTTYVMSAFNATSENKLSIFTSYDGVTYTSLAEEAYTPPSGLLRDPSIIRASDGDYYVVY